MPCPIDLEARVNLSLAVTRYLHSADRFNEASRDFTSACRSLRQQLGNDQRFVVQVSYKHYLVTSDGDGNFDIELVESL